MSEKNDYFFEEENYCSFIYMANMKIVNRLK